MIIYIMRGLNFDCLIVMKYRHDTDIIHSRNFYIYIQYVIFFMNYYNLNSKSECPKTFCVIYKTLLKKKNVFKHVLENDEFKNIIYYRQLSYASI